MANYFLIYLAIKLLIQIFYLIKINCGIFKKSLIFISDAKLRLALLASRLKCLTRWEILIQKIYVKNSWFLKFIFTNYFCNCSKFNLCRKFLANILIKKYWSRLKFYKLLQSSTQLVNLELNKSLVSEVFLYYKIVWLYLVDCRLTPRQLDSDGHFCATGLYSAQRNRAALRLLLY